jgi:hypothetical protein
MVLFNCYCTPFVREQWRTYTVFNVNQTFSNIEWLDAWGKKVVIKLRKGFRFVLKTNRYTYRIWSV